MTQLKTDWLCIATSGTTIDRRQITPIDLQQMAETYKPETYTALIWQEHSRFHGNFGQVLELKTTREGDKTKLFAKLRPNAKLVELNQQKQKLFTSVEIIPNFANTGKAYLGGLAITDSPASIGTTQLNFSAKGIQQADLKIGNKELFKFSLSVGKAEIKKLVEEFNKLSFADKNALFSYIDSLAYQFNAERRNSLVMFISAKEAFYYERFNLAV